MPGHSYKGSYVSQAAPAALPAPVLSPRPVAGLQFTWGGSNPVAWWFDRTAPTSIIHEFQVGPTLRTDNGQAIHAKTYVVYGVDVSGVKVTGVSNPAVSN